MPIDKELFLNQPVDGAFATEFTSVPADEYIARIAEGGVSEPVEKLGEKGLSVWVDITWTVIDEAKLKKVQEETGRDTPTVRQRIFLDVLRDENDKVVGMDKGKSKNVVLGQLRAAVGQNDPRKKWAFKHLEMQVARIKVEHETYEGRTNARVAFLGVTKA